MEPAMGAMPKPQTRKQTWKPARGAAPARRLARRPWSMQIGTWRGTCTTRCGKRTITGASYRQPRRGRRQATSRRCSSARHSANEVRGNASMRYPSRAMPTSSHACSFAKSRARGRPRCPAAVKAAPRAVRETALVAEVFLVSPHQEREQNGVLSAPGCCPRVGAGDQPHGAATPAYATALCAVCLTQRAALCLGVRPSLGRQQRVRRRGQRGTPRLCRQAGRRAVTVLVCGVVGRPLTLRPLLCHQRSGC